MDKRDFHTSARAGSQALGFPVIRAPILRAACLIKGFLVDPSEELIKLIRAEADEPHHSDLGAALPLCVCNYTCIISAVNSGHRHFLLLLRLPLLCATTRPPSTSLFPFAMRVTHRAVRHYQKPDLPGMTITLLLSAGLWTAPAPSWTGRLVSVW